MTNRVYYVLLAALLSFACDDTSEYYLSGVVTDSESYVLPDVQVTANNSKIFEDTKSTTDQNGRYEFYGSNLDIAQKERKVTITFEANGYTTYTTRTRVLQGVVKSVNVTLKEEVEP